MGYNRENYRRIRQEYDGKNLRAKEAAEERRRELHAKFPDIEELDAALSMTGLELMEAASRLRGEALEEQIAKIRKNNRSLLAARSALLEQHGYPADYTAVRYECPECMDTGFIGGKMCRCMRKKLILAGYESSGIGHLIRTQSFDTFSPAYQQGDRRAYAVCTANLAVCREYAEHFNPAEGKNLLMVGNTGLGKTHLSTAIAKCVIDRGFDVVYVTAPEMFSDFEGERFGYRRQGDGTERTTDRFFDCDLLILDDLGTEAGTQFTLSCLYNLINTRLNHCRSMIMNTNLGQEELRRRYTDRIASRLFGEFSPLLFIGKDVRAVRKTTDSGPANS